MQELSKGTVQSVQSYGELSRDDLREIFGVDCQERLDWRNWQPGGEYVKNLVLKNVTTKTINLKYKLTKTKVFSMDFPELIKLSAGMSVSVRVVFRPLKMEEYVDHVEFVSGDRSFVLTIQAFLPATQLQVPTSIDFGFVPSKETAIIPFTVRNTGDVKVSFEWVLEAPFSVRPASANLPPGTTSNFECFFEPHDAASFTGTALCKMESGASPIVQVSGIAKFPYLSIEQSAVDFGSVMVGQTVEKAFRFGNHSIVAANFIVEHADTAGDGVFAVSPSKGTLKPDEYSIIQVTYTPKHTGTFSCENFTISTPGGNQLTLNLRGMAAGPVVTFSTRSFNFGNVGAGQPSSRVLYMQNHSDVPVVYAFDADPLDMFVFSRLRGSIPPRTTGHVTITFKSAVPANYWRRIACVIKDSDPIAIDLLATCFDEKSRPPPVSHRHIAAYISRLSEGGPPVLPSSVGPVPSAAETAPGSALLSRLPPTELTELNQAIQELPGPDAWDLLFAGQDPATAVTVDEPLLDFGMTSRLSSSEYKTITATNHTDAKLLAFISVPSWQDPSGGEPRPVFQVFPEQAEIKPRGQACFRVAFRPPRDGQYYSCGLQLVAFVKSMRNFRLVSEAQMVPPWSVRVMATGNTFLHCHPEHSPKVQMSHSLVAFPPCRPGEKVHQTLQLLNYGDTPVHFSFQGALAGVFTVNPAMGVVPPGTHCLIGLRFAPSEARAHAAKVMCIFNGSAANASELQLRGTAHLPRMVIDAAGSSMFFRPTCIGASSQRALTLHNPSRVPIAFRWQLPAKAAGVVEVAPVSGVLRGNESCQVQWTFRPSAQKTYDLRVACAMFTPGAQGPDLQVPEQDPTEPGPLETFQALDQLYLHVVGEGTVGAITIEPGELQLGPINVGYPVKRSVTLINQSDGVLRYTADILQVQDSQANDEEDLGTVVQWRQVGVPSEGQHDGEWWVDEPEGAISAKASKLIHVTLLPRHRRLYNLQLQVRSTTVSALSATPGGRPGSSGGSFTKKLLPLGQAVGAPSASPTELAPPAIAPIVARAQFPAVAVTDVACEGQPKTVVWGTLGINDLNAELGSTVTQIELNLVEMEEKGSLSTELASRSLRPFPIDFGPQAVGCAPVAYHMRLSNISDVPAHWEFHSYDDPQLEMENWVEPGAPTTEEEKHRDFIVEAKLFDVQPRHGNLAPGEHSIITFVYNPTHTGSHHWPIFFHISDGKRIHFQMTGSTVTASVQHLAMLPTTRTFTFEPVAIGDPASPQQMVTLRNGGPAPLTWTIDLSPLEALTASNYGFRVLQCLSAASGQMPPGGVAPLNWQFTPVEAKEYSVTLDVTLGNGNVEQMVLVGRGYHPKLREQSSPLPGEGARHWPCWPHFSPLARLCLPSQIAMLDRDVVDLRTVLVQGIARQLLQLTNRSSYPLIYTWHMGMLDPACEAVRGQLSISPASGRLEPGEQLVCRLTFTAGLEPQLFEGEVHCVVEVDPHETVSSHPARGERASYATGEFPLQQGNMLVLPHGGDGGEASVELIAESPTRDHTRPKPGTLLRNRLPVASSTTTSLRNRLEPLAQRYNDTVAAITQRRAQAHRPPPIPQPQVLTLGVCGRILSLEHIKANSFVPDSAQEAAQQLLTGSSWTAPTTRPFWCGHVDGGEPGTGRDGDSAASLGCPPAGTSQAAHEPELEAAESRGTRFTSLHGMSRSVEQIPRAPAPGQQPQRAQLALDASDPGYRAAVAVLEAAMAEAVEDPDLRATLHALDKEPVPLFAEIRAAVPWPYLRPQDPAELPASPETAPSSSADNGEYQDGSTSESTAVQHDGLTASGQPDTEAQEAEAALSALRTDAHFRALAEYVADNAILALVQESVAGDWRLVEAL